VQPSIVIAIYALLVVLSSLLGGFLPAFIRLSHTRLQLLLSGIGGLMLGIGLFHLLPHSLNAEVSIDRAVWWLMLGLLTTFLLIRVFSSHDHGHGHDSHTEAGGDGCSHEGPHRLAGSKYRWVGIALGLSLHTLLDGVALSAAVLSDRQHMSEGIFLGFAVFLGILLHKPLDSLSITTLMAGSGWSVRSQAVVNFVYAMMCPLGSLAFYLGVRNTPYEMVVIGCALAFAGGIFICISLGDLLPELQFHTHDRFKLTAMLLFGVALAHGLRYLEPAHLHDHNSHSHDHNFHPAEDTDHDHDKPHKQAHEQEHPQ